MPRRAGSVVSPGHTFPLRPGCMTRCHPVFDASLSPPLRSESPRLVDQFTNQLSSATKAAEDLCTPVGCVQRKRGWDEQSKTRVIARASLGGCSIIRNTCVECCSSWHCDPAHRNSQQKPAQQTTQRITNGPLVPVASASVRGNRRCENMRGKECITPFRTRSP